MELVSWHLSVKEILSTSILPICDLFVTSFDLATPNPAGKSVWWQPAQPVEGRGQHVVCGQRRCPLKTAGPWGFPPPWRLSVVLYLSCTGVVLEKTARREREPWAVLEQSTILVLSFL